VERIYGLGNFEASSEKEVALSLNRSEKKIRAIRDRALKIMAGPTESALGSMLGSEHEMLGIAA
jgi:hypothetical protein